MTTQGNIKKKTNKSLCMSVCCFLLIKKTPPMSQLGKVQNRLFVENMRAEAAASTYRERTNSLVTSVQRQIIYRISIRVKPVWSISNGGKLLLSPCSPSHHYILVLLRCRASRITKKPQYSSHFHWKSNYDDNPGPSKAPEILISRETWLLSAYRAKKCRDYITRIS